MNAPPEANSQYSRGSKASRPYLPVIALGALLGALLIVIAQFTALSDLHSATRAAPIKTVGTGANHAWAPIPLALAAAALAWVAYRYENRAALLGIAVLGIATLLIALLGDLPDARSSGLVGSGAAGYVQATSTPSAGLYMETLGAVLLLLSGGVGFLMLAGPIAGDRRARSLTPQANPPNGG